MTLKPTRYSFTFFGGQHRAALDRLAEEISENEGMAEHADKAQDPVQWERGRLRRTGSARRFLAADSFGAATKTERTTGRNA